jgi:homoserine dehydrogenase
MEEVETAYYLRMRAVDRPGVLADVSRYPRRCRHQHRGGAQKREPAEGETEVPLVMLTHRVSERQMNEALAPDRGARRRSAGRSRASVSRASAET